MNHQSHDLDVKSTKRIVIFAKAPLAGYAKTRLIPELGLEGSARLACKLLKNAVSQALAANIGSVELCVSPSVHHPIWKQLDLPQGVLWSYQGEGDLGQRMARATQRILRQGESVVLMGADCPRLDAHRIRLAAHALETANACLVPVSDGGYSLLGLNQYVAALFTGIPWSTESVARLTRQRMATAGYSMKELEVLHDIDTPDDLRHLPPGWL